MKKLLSLIMALILSISLVACGGADTSAPTQSSSGGSESVAQSDNDSTTPEVKFVSMTFGEITMSVPDVFKAVTENQGMYVSAGPDSSIVVGPSMEIDLLPSEWDENLAQSILEPMYGSTYTDMELSAFDGDVSMNGNTAVYFAFNGKNSDGKERLVHVLRLFNADQTAQYYITFIHSAEDSFFTPELDNKIINSIALGK